MNIEHNEIAGKGRFEAKDNDKYAGKLEYSRKEENQMVIEHTEVDPGFQGEGVGKKLVHHSAEFARENNLKIVPQCAYAKKILERTSDYDDVLA